MVDSSVIREMLDELRFEEAEQLVAQAGGDVDRGLREEIISRRAEAEKRAQTVARKVIELGEAQRLEEVAALAREPSTVSLIELAPGTSRKRAELYLREGARWEERRRETNTRRLNDAREALGGLDLEMARGLMNKIDGRFLTSEQEEERDQLLLDISARSMEMESLNQQGDRLIDHDEPRRNKDRNEPWWRRWFG